MASFAPSLLKWFVPLCGWACYAPLGIKYVAYGGCILLSLWVLKGDWHSPWQQPGARWLLALLGLLALSVLWSVAPWADRVAHLWTYALMAWMLIIVVACPPAIAERALAHFAAASAAVGLLFVLRAAGLLPASGLWISTLDATGNQRVVTSLLLALGCVLALWLSTRQATRLAQGAALAGAAVATAGLLLQDRRTGMVLLPLMLMAWGLARQRGLTRKVICIVAVALAALLTWQASQGVRTRFAEGLAELRAYPSTDAVDTSWGQRLRMLELTGAMVREHPVLGYGVGSWQTAWRQRVTPQTALAVHSTPHNEYLLFAMQSGAVGLALYLAWLGARILQAARSGPPGAAALMVWTAIATAGLFNAVVRDAKFALPLMLLAGLAGAVAHQPEERDGRI